MIDRDGPWIEIACDECGALTGDAFDKDEFREMVTAARNAGWKIVPGKHHGEWDHVCPLCQEPPLERSRVITVRTEPTPNRQEFDADIEALLGRSRDHA